MAVEVSRASQTHQTPQVGRPQSMPMTRVSAVNTMAISADAAAVMSHQRDFFQRYMTLAERRDHAADVGHRRRSARGCR